MHGSLMWGRVDRFGMARCVGSAWIVLLAPSLFAQQTPPTASKAIPATTELPSVFGQLLPTVRALSDVPSVSAVSQFQTVRGTPVQGTVNATAAFGDVEMYRAQLESLFPLDAEHYPTDSIRQLIAARAAAWIARLQPMAAFTSHRMLIAYARLAIRAQRDSVAYQLFDRRLEELMPGRSVAPGERSVEVERALTITGIVMALADSSQPPDQRQRNIRRAVRYARQMAAIRIKGYSTVSDSTSILIAKGWVWRVLFHAGYVSNTPDVVFESSDQILATRKEFKYKEWMTNILEGYRYREIAAMLLAQPHGRERLDSLQRRLLTVIAVGPDDSIPAGDPEHWRTAPSEGLRRQFAIFDRIGQPFPPIKAAAWINTPDSLYNEQTRAKTWNDGIIHIIVWADMSVNEVPLANWLAARLPPGYQVVLVTWAEGRWAADAVSPSEDVALLRQWYRDRRRVRVPVGVKTGKRVPGMFGMHPISYDGLDYEDLAGWDFDRQCFVLDGEGILRWTSFLRTRDDATLMLERLKAMPASSHVTATPPRT